MNWNHKIESTYRRYNNFHYCTRCGRKAINLVNWSVVGAGVGMFLFVILMHIGEHFNLLTEENHAFILLVCAPLFLSLIFVVIGLSSSSPEKEHVILLPCIDEGEKDEN
ncbi:MAG: hypothetical protein HXS54_05925 [Theionarchaea archaeon]|nr:hypothetical protein [Theionarchaea archaeon]DBA34796.1 TPA_asm: hypothetical protein vir521_00002 [Caudoviricetes sp. vir521]